MRCITLTTANCGIELIHEMVLLCMSWCALFYISDPPNAEKLSKADVHLRGPKRIDSYNNITIEILYVCYLFFWQFIAYVQANLETGVIRIISLNQKVFGRFIRFVLRFSQLASNHFCKWLREIYCAIRERHYQKHKIDLQVFWM